MAREQQMQRMQERAGVALVLLAAYPRGAARDGLAAVPGGGEWRAR